MEGALPQEDKGSQRPVSGALHSTSAPPGQAASVFSVPQHHFLIAGCPLGFGLQVAPGIRVSLCSPHLGSCGPALPLGCKCRELSGGGDPEASPKAATAHPTSSCQLHPRPLRSSHGCE